MRLPRKSTSLEMNSEGTSGAQAVYSERLWPSIGLWFFVLIMTVSLGIAYGRAYGTDVGVIVGAIASGAGIFALLKNTPTIRIDELNFQVGRARMPLRFIGQVQILDEEQSRRARSTDAHKDAFFQLRGGVKQTLIVEITDQSDPHPYWQISTRNPKLIVEKFAEAKNNI
jgi:hypothetical protein